MWVQIDPIRPLSSVWTVESFLTLVRSMLGELDSAKVTNYELRLYTNMALSRLALLIRAKDPDCYGVKWLFEPDAVPYANYLEHDLSAPYMQALPDVGTKEAVFPKPQGMVLPDSIIPNNVIAEIKGISFRNRNSNDADLWTGKAMQVSDPSALVSIASQENGIYRQSIIWARQGHRLLFFFGTEIQTAPTTLVDGYAYTRPYTGELFATRKPLLDDLKPELADENLTDFRNLLDIPDEYVNLLALHVKKIVRETKGALDQATTQAIQGMEQELTGVPENGEATQGAGGN